MASRARMHVDRNEDFDEEFDELAEELELEEGDDLDVPHCRVCGCSEFHPCPGGCLWAAPDLCSRCVNRA